MSYNYQDHEALIVKFEKLWREEFSAYPPMDTMSREEREKFKEYTRQVYMMAKEKRSYYSW